MVSPTNLSTGFFGYLFSEGTQRNMVDMSPFAKMARKKGSVDIFSKAFRRSYEEES
jgi:hypothetical protein